MARRGTDRSSRQPRHGSMWPITDGRRWASHGRHGKHGARGLTTHGPAGLGGQRLAGLDPAPIVTAGMAPPGDPALVTPWQATRRRVRSGIANHGRQRVASSALAGLRTAGSAPLGNGLAAPHRSQGIPRDAGRRTLQAATARHRRSRHCPLWLASQGLFSLLMASPLMAVKAMMRESTIGSDRPPWRH